MKWCLLLPLLCQVSLSDAKKPKEKPEWAKKNIADYSDADLERLYEQWEEDEEPIPLDELPAHDPRKPQPQIDFSKLNMRDTDSVLRATKKGKALMIFVKVNGDPTKAETEEITSIWQTGLWNSHIQSERFQLEDDRVIFMFQDGEMAFDARDFLIEQERCEDVQFEQQTYCGKHSLTCEEDKKKKEEEDEKKRKKAEKDRKKKEKKEKEKKLKEKEEEKDEL